MDKDKLRGEIMLRLDGRSDSAARYDVQVDDRGGVIVVIEVDPERGQALEDLRQDVEREISAMSGVCKVSAILTAKKKTKVARGRDPHGMDKNPPVHVPARRIIAVASGKGGVGKSTVAANIAACLAGVHGKSVGLLDADIYGPSQPLMMGDTAYKPSLNADKKLVPAMRHGVKIMSIGFIADTDKALVWRGPMVQTAFYQMLRDVDWGSVQAPLDYLIIDLPPGTGDVQLTLAQKVHVDGAVIVSTPQDIALIDARRAVQMFEKTGVKVLGLVENMSTHICSHCGHEDPVFGHGGAEHEARELGLDFLGALPLSRDVREMSDGGTPIVLGAPDSLAAKAFQDIVSKIVRAI